MTTTESTQALAETQLELTKDQVNQIWGASSANVDTKAEVQVHRVAILQPGSPEISGGVTGYKPGQLCDNRTREILSYYLRQPWLAAKGVPEAELSECHCMLIAPVLKLPTEFMKWIKQEDRKPGEPPFEFKTLDQTDPRVRAGVWPARGGTWGRNPDEKGKAPPVTDNINWMVVPIDLERKTMKSSFIINTFSRTSADAGKMLTTFVENQKMLGQLPWGQTYWVWTKKELNTRTNSTYYTMQVAPGPQLMAVAPDLSPVIMGMAIWLSDKHEGRSRQETILNAADISDESSHEVTDQSVAGAATPTNNPLGGAEDPFAATTQPATGF